MLLLGVSNLSAQSSAINLQMADLYVIEFFLSVVYATLLIAQSLRSNNLLLAPLFILGLALPVITNQSPLLGGGLLLILFFFLFRREIKLFILKIKRKKTC